MTRNQALAFVDACVSSPKVKSHLGAVLGYGHVPALTDFSSRDEDSIAWCDEMISYLESVSGVLRELQKVRDRQAEIALDPTPPLEAEGETLEEIEEKPELAKRLRRGASQVTFNG